MSALSVAASSGCTKRSPSANCENRRPAYGARGRGTIVLRSLTRNRGWAASAELRSVGRLGLGRLEDLGALDKVFLLIGVGLGTVVIGTGTAWLVTMCRFPGSRMLQWALLLPLVPFPRP